MPGATAQGFVVLSDFAGDIDAKATSLAAEANIDSATVEKYTKYTRIDVSASESAGGADDASEQIDNAITAVGDLMQQPGTEYVTT